MRQQTDTVQALLVQSQNEISKQMYKFAASINPESIVLVRGTVKKSSFEIKATTVQDAEIHIAQVQQSLIASLYFRSSLFRNQLHDCRSNWKMHNDQKHWKSQVLSETRKVRNKNPQQRQETRKSFESVSTPVSTTVSSTCVQLRHKLYSVSKVELAPYFANFS